MGNKYSKAADKIQREQAFKKEQKDLHKKYDVPDHIIIKEKNNIFKFTVNTLKNLIKTIAGIVLMLLAVIGLLTIIYPEPRMELELLLQQIINDVMQMLGMS